MTQKLSDGYFRLALCSPELSLGKPEVNAQRQARTYQNLAQEEVDLTVFPPLSLSGVSLGDLNLQPQILAGAYRQVISLAAKTKDQAGAFLTSLPVQDQGQVYALAVHMQEGKADNYKFLPVQSHNRNLQVFAQNSPGSCAKYPSMEGRYKASNSGFACQKDFTCSVFSLDQDGRIIASDEEKQACRGNLALVFDYETSVLGQRDLIRARAKAFSKDYACGLAYISPNQGESSQDGVYSGYRLVAEAGEIIAESDLFASDPLIVDLDLEYLRGEASRTGTFDYPEDESLYHRFYSDEAEPETNKKTKQNISKDRTKAKLYRDLDPLPFLPSESESFSYYEESLVLLAQGLMRRMKLLPKSKLVLGLSGGLDSTLALLIALKALDKLGRPRTDLVIVNMPGPGSHDRSQSNAEDLATESGATFKSIDINRAVEVHLADIGHDGQTFDVTYENAQARERTQILMDLANHLGGIVLGTGDLSELALGWCTYNGDQMSMYNLNASVPKTLVRALCQHEAELYGQQNPRFAELIFDVIATPVSPELLPRGKEAFLQKTEDIIGPYELHDFFIWHLLKRHASPSKALDLAKLTFAEHYENDLIEESFKIFLRRFVQNQFKRSASPDGASLGLVSLSPRAGFVMPSDLDGDVLIRGLDLEN